MKKISTLVSALILVAVSVVPSVAQTNNGSACGCPTVASRPSVNLSTLAVSGGAGDGDLLANTILTCDKLWILDKKIYVPNGVTLSIQTSRSSTIRPWGSALGNFQRADCRVLSPRFGPIDNPPCEECHVQVTLVIFIVKIKSVSIL